MAQFDAIVVGAGHNGLASAVMLQKAGLRTLCLESKLYSGGMASTVELFDGFKFEIAGSEQFPTSLKVSQELVLDEVPSVEQPAQQLRIGRRQRRIARRERGFLANELCEAQRAGMTFARHEQHRAARRAHPRLGLAPILFRHGPSWI